MELMDYSSVTMYFLNDEVHKLWILRTRRLRKLANSFSLSLETKATHLDLFSFPPLQTSLPCLFVSTCGPKIDKKGGLTLDSV